MASFDAFQGGAHVELFDARAHDATGRRMRRDDSRRSRALGRWRGGVARAYDASARGYVVRVRGAGDGALCCGDVGGLGTRGEPLGATQPILVLQLRAEAGAHFSFEVAVRDVSDARRRLLFSSAFSDVRATPLHCQVPLRDLPRDEWVSLLLPLVELVPVCFSSASVAYKSIDSICIRGECWIRKVFTLRGDTQAQAWTDSRDGEMPRHAIVIPRECDFPESVRAAAHTVIPSQDYDLHDKQEDERRARTRELRRPIKVAFGRRAPSSASFREREHLDAAPARAFEQHDDDDEFNDERWSDLDHIMSNLRVRESKSTARGGEISPATSSSSSYRSSRYSVDDVAPEPSPRLAPTPRAVDSSPLAPSRADDDQSDEEEDDFHDDDFDDDDFDDDVDFDDDSDAAAAAGDDRASNVTDDFRARASARDAHDDDDGDDDIDAFTDDADDA